MPARKVSSKNYRDSISINDFSSTNSIFDGETSIKKIASREFGKRRITLNLLVQNRQAGKPFHLDLIKQRNPSSKDTSSSSDLTERKQFHTLKTDRFAMKATKGVRFNDRMSIQSLKTNDIKKKDILAEITDKERISMLNRIAKNKDFSLPMTARKRIPQSMRLANNLMNSAPLSSSSAVQEIKCFMCHYPQENSILFEKKMIASAKQRLQKMSDVSVDQGTFFRYEAFGYFLKSLNDINYDSMEVINAYETVLIKYTYPTSIKLMLYYTGSFLYQFNNLYDRSEDILTKICEELLKFQLYEYIGIYLILMVKQKANLLEWELCSRYLMKLLAYAWLHKFDELEIWVYYELSRSYFFMNRFEESQYFKKRSQMSIIQPASNIYRDLIGKQLIQELIYMRREHQPFNLERTITNCELMKLVDQPLTSTKEKDDFKLQSQIKSINDYCKIKHVKNLLSRMSSSPEIKKSRNMTEGSYEISRFSKKYAGNPLLRTHESGLKNLNIYFRNNRKGKSLVNKNREPKLYTFENSNTNIFVLRELCRSILMEMKFYLPINGNES